MHLFSKDPRSYTKNGHSLVMFGPIHLFCFLCKWLLVTMPWWFMIIFGPGYWFRVDRLADGFLTGIQNLFRCPPNLITKIYIPHMTPTFYCLKGPYSCNTHEYERFSNIEMTQTELSWLGLTYIQAFLILVSQEVNEEICLKKFFL